MPSTSPEITYRRWMLAGSAGSEENYYSLGVMVPATLHAPFVALNQRAQMGGFNPPPRIAAAMMIDTGATGCVVDTRVVDALKLVPKRHTKMMQADGILVPTRIYELTAVLFFSSDEGTETLAINIEAAEMKVTTVGVEGILGRNFLRLFRFEVDGSRGTWSLSYDQPVPADMVPLK